MFGGGFFISPFPPMSYKLIFQVFHSRTSGLQLPSTDWDGGMGVFLSGKFPERLVCCQVVYGIS